MSRLEWGGAGTRYYESGVDRGVLYVNNIGHAWNGLISVSENPSGGEARPYYIDGVKYLNIPSPEEFKATLEALSAPPQFAQCDGSRTLGKGLFALHQKRVSFGLSYRTAVGNDVDDLSHGYKIHLVYNALAAPSEKAYSTTNVNPTPVPLSWDLTTKPVQLGGTIFSAHLVIDSTEAEPGVIDAVENILYGTDMSTPRLPLPPELINIFNSAELFNVTEDPQAGSFTVTAPDDAITMLDAGTFQITWESAINLDEDTFQISSL